MQLHGGGVAVAFDTDISGGHDVLVHRYNGSLGAFSTDNIGTGSAAAVAAFADGGYVVSQTVADAGRDHIYAHVVSAGGAVSAPISINTDAAHDSAGSRVAVLSNGDFVVTYTHYNGTDDDVRLQIRTEAGVAVVQGAGVAGAGDAADERASDVAALKDGGFVVAWTDSAGDSSASGVRATIYNNAGAVVRSDFLVNSTQSASQSSPSVTPLSDGTFIVSWADFGASLTEAQRFDAPGNTVGAEFTVQTGADVQTPSRAVELKDGRIAYGLGHFVSDRDIDTRIFDPRTSPINGTAAADTLTGRIDGGTVNGLGGNDTPYGFAAKDTLAGGSGDDELSAGRGQDKLDGSTGADELEGGRGADRMDAGADDDRDVFVFASKHDSGHGKKGGWDKLYDFDTHGKHEKVSDKIDLSAIDADKHEKHDQKFRFVDHFETAGKHQPHGEVMVQDDGKNVKVLVDVNGDKDADMIVQVMHVQDLHRADFIL